MTATTDRSDRLATIRGLLHKAESTPYPEEAEAFMAKASELMSRHAISDALLWADGNRHDSPTEIRIELLRPFVPQKAVLISAVSSSLGCQALRLGDTGAPNELVSVVGFERDLERVEALVTSLMVQLTTALHHQCPSTGSPHETASWRRSFISGFTETVVARLREERARATENAGVERGDSTRAGAEKPSLSVVLANRSDSVDAELRRRYPYVRSSSVSTGRSRGGRSAGRTEGGRADLGHSRLGPRHALGA